MTKLIILLFGLSIQSLCFAQNNSIKLKPNTKEQQFSITREEEQTFEIDLQESLYYNISAEQKGIDIVLYVKDKNKKILVEQDSPNGKFGLEKTTFSPDVSGKYYIVVKPLNEKENSSQGNYIIRVSTISNKLKQYSKSQLQEDFDILKNAYIETKVGLWYNTYEEFDSLSNVQRNKIKDKMTSWEFYKIAAPLTTFTKEGHSAIRTSDETNDFFLQYGTYFPLFVKIIDKKIYVLNDYQNLKTKGLIISKINGIDAYKILETFTEIEPADGYNYTSKYKWIETSFSRYLLRFYGLRKSFNIEFIDSKNNRKISETVESLNNKSYNKLRSFFYKENPDYTFSKPILLKIDVTKDHAILTVNTFSANQYEGGKKGFQKYLDSIFLEINNKHIKNLIIDVRKNEGGNQGMEDILLSHLVTKSYKKYDYVEIPSFEYSFLEYTDYKNEKDILEKELSDEFIQQNDGRYINKSEKYQGLSPSPIHFEGNIYVLIGGLTFSGGSEFAALAKNHTDAVFIGEETGGGYYGNTSGSFLKFTLPNTGIAGRIPLCKFAVSTSKNSIPFGRGLIPDYQIQPTFEEYINGIDRELEFALKLLSKK